MADINVNDLPDPATASDEEYDNAVAGLLDGSITVSNEDQTQDDDVNEQTNEEDEETGSNEPDTSEEQDNKVEQPESDEEDDELENVDEQATGEVDESDDNKDSTNKSKEQSGYKYDEIPMDEIMPFEIKAGGQKMKVTMNELISGFQKGVGFTKNMQSIAPFKRSIGIMEDYDITEDDLNLLVEVKAKNKDAIAKILSDSGLDSFDINTEDAGDYIPTDHGKDVIDDDMEQVKSEINSDVDNVDTVREAINTMPDDFYQIVSSNSDALRHLHSDVKNGIYQQVMPEVIKQQALSGSKEPTTAMYVRIARQMFSSEQAQAKAEVQKQTQQEATNKSKDLRRKAGSGTKQKTKTSKPVSKKIDDMSDDEFAKDFEKIMGRSLEEFKDL